MDLDTKYNNLVIACRKKKLRKEINMESQSSPEKSIQDKIKYEVSLYLFRKDLNLSNQ